MGFASSLQVTDSGNRAYNFGGERFELRRDGVETLIAYNTVLRTCEMDQKFLVVLILCCLNPLEKLRENHIDKNLYNFITLLFTYRAEAQPERMCQLAPMIENAIRIAKEMHNRKRSG